MVKVVEWIDYETLALLFGMVTKCIFCSKCAKIITFNIEMFPF